MNYLYERIWKFLLIYTANSWHLRACVHSCFVAPADLILHSKQFSSSILSVKCPGRKKHHQLFLTPHLKALSSKKRSTFGATVLVYVPSTLLTNQNKKGVGLLPIAKEKPIWLASLRLFWRVVFRSTAAAFTLHAFCVIFPWIWKYEAHRAI